MTNGRHIVGLGLLLVVGFAIMGNPSATAQGYIFNELAPTLSTPGPYGYVSMSSAQADFNADGLPDLAVTAEYLSGGPQFALLVYLAQSDGEYTLSASYTTGAYYWVTTGDLNGDHKPDLVYSTQYPGAIQVQFGNGDGTFQPPIVSSTPALNPAGLVLADFNGDHNLDLALLDLGTSNFYIQLGNANGTFQQASTHTLGQAVVSQVIAPDLNKDGLVDIVVTTSAGINVFVGDGTGTFGSFTLYPLNGLAGIAAADMNNDGKLDLVIVSFSPSGVVVSLGSGDGTFGTLQFTSVPGNIAGSPALADFDGDGALDVAMPGGWEGIAVLLGNGSGAFKPVHSEYGNAWNYATGVVAGDYNLDGKMDIAAIGALGSGEPFTILSNNGDGTFSVGRDIPVAAASGVASGDFNGDGKVDLAAVVSVNSEPTVAIYLGRGNGSFAPPKYYPAGSSVQDIFVGDFNNDQKEDLVVENIANNSISILLGNGDGTFGPPRRYLTGATPDSVAIADLNNDGKQDLLVADGADNDVNVFFGNGNGTFTRGQPVDVGGTSSPWQK